MFVEPWSSDPEVIAKKFAVNPKVRTPGKATWVTDADGKIVDFDLGAIRCFKRLRDLYLALFYNSIVTHIPFHFIRLGYLRLCGATIGKGSAINRGTTVWSDPHDRDRRSCLDRFSVSARRQGGHRNRQRRGHCQRRAHHCWRSRHQPSPVRSGSQPGRSGRHRRPRVDRESRDDLAELDRTGGRGRRAVSGYHRGASAGRRRWRSRRRSSLSEIPTHCSTAASTRCRSSNLA